MAAKRKKLRAIGAPERRRVAIALAAAESYLVERIKRGEKDVNARDVAAHLALDLVQPAAWAWNPKLVGQRLSLVELVAEAGGASMSVRSPGWALEAIAQSLADMMRDAPNYVTATATLPGRRDKRAEGERFEVVLRRIGKGKTAHELRQEAEARADILETQVRALEVELAALRGDPMAPCELEGKSDAG